MIPTGWYPGAVRLSADGKQLFVANVKGHGSLQPARRSEPRRRPTQEEGATATTRPPRSSAGKNSHDHLGSVSLIDLPDAAGLKKHTGP